MRTKGVGLHDEPPTSVSGRETGGERKGDMRRRVQRGVDAVEGGGGVEDEGITTVDEGGVLVEVKKRGSTQTCRIGANGRKRVALGL